MSKETNKAPLTQIRITVTGGNLSCHKSGLFVCFVTGILQFI